jgi:hypothetical protein
MLLIGLSSAVACVFFCLIQQPLCHAWGHMQIVTLLEAESFVYIV